MPRQYNIFKEISNYLDKILIKVISNQNLVKLLKFTNPTCLSEPDLDFSEASKLLNVKVFKHKRIDSIDIETDSKIVLSISDFIPTENPEFLQCLMCCKIIVHKEILDLDGGQDRLYEMMNEFYYLMKDDRSLGIGRVRFYDANEFIPNNDKNYIGFQFRYEIVDFN